MNNYIGPTPITAYGCVLCQREHRMGMDADYAQHIYRQSKHGVYTRAPRGAAEEFAATVQAEERKGEWALCKAMPDVRVDPTTGLIRGGTYDGMTPEQVLRQREEYNRLSGE